MKQVDPIQDPAAEEVTIEEESRLSRWSRRKQASRVVENVPESPAATANTGSGTDGQVLQNGTFVTSGFVTSSTQDELAKSVGSIMALEVLEVSTCWCFDAWHTCTQTASTCTDRLIIQTLDFHGQILD